MFLSETETNFDYAHVVLLGIIIIIISICLSLTR